MSFTIDPDLLGLTDSVALVIGGGGAGMGRSHCLQLARAGCHVVVADLDVEAAEETARLVRELGRSSVPVRVDALSELEISASIDLCYSTFGRLDVAVNHVGGFVRRAPVLDIDPSDWDRTVAISLKSAFLCGQAEAAAMIEHDTAGRIINVAATSGIAASEVNGAYGAAKAGVIHLTKTMAVELAKFGLRVNCVVPGSHEIVFGKTLDVPAEESDSVHWSLDANANAAPMRRLGRADETAGVTVFLASNLSSFVTGQAVVSDGGMLLTLRRPARDGIPERVVRMGKGPVVP